MKNDAYTLGLIYANLEDVYEELRVEQAALNGIINKLETVQNRLICLVKDEQFGNSEQLPFMEKLGLYAEETMKP